MKKKSSQCAVSRGEVDPAKYAEIDGEWRALGLAAPARRALVDAGITTVKQLKKFSREEIAALHGMGPNAMKKIQSAL